MTEIEVSSDGTQSGSAIAAQKEQLRRELLRRRRELPDKDERSRQIMARVMALSEFKAAECVMFYVDARSEVRTRQAIKSALAGGKQIVVPYCAGDVLVPWRLHAWDELALGAFNILEPRGDLRERPERRVDPRSIDIVLVPGVAFDRQGRRLGSGRGYYDRLLPLLRADALKVAVAFDCQIVPDVPAEDHDMLMDVVVAEDVICICGRN